MQLYSPTQGSKRVVYPFSFFHVWTTFEHQVQGTNAIQNIQVHSSSRQPQKNSGNSGATDEQV